MLEKETCVDRLLLDKWYISLDAGISKSYKIFWYFILVEHLYFSQDENFKHNLKIVVLIIKYYSYNIIQIYPPHTFYN